MARCAIAAAGPVTGGQTEVEEHAVIAAGGGPTGGRGWYLPAPSPEGASGDRRLDGLAVEDR